jgi:hypothetical protein
VLQIYEKPMANCFREASKLNFSFSELVNFYLLKLATLLQQKMALTLAFSACWQHLVTCEPRVVGSTTVFLRQM